MKGENVRPDEIKAMGLDTFLKDKKNVTTAEVQDFIAQNKIKLGESVYGKSKEDIVGLAKRKEVFDKYASQINSLYMDIDSMPLYMKVGERSIANPRRLRMEDNLNDLQLKRDAEADLVYKIPENKQTKFQNYALPGGENYREIVLTLPSNVDDLAKRQLEIEKLLEATDLTNKQRNALRLEYREASDKIRGGSTYQSNHWDEPNTLSHLRVSDRVTDGKKTLLIDEVQSDWHQAGREQGYVDPNKKPFTVEADQYGVYRIKDANGQTFSPYVDGDQMSGFMTKEAAENAMQNNMTRLPKSKGVPDAPYKDDWYQLTLRRAIKEAIDGGYDRVALPTGARVNERFSLSKQVDQIDYFKKSDGTYSISGLKDNNTLFVKGNLSEKELSGFVGKDIAKKMMDNEGEPYNIVSGVESPTRVLKGLDLEVGGEGNKKYYDEIYPGYLKKFGKKYGSEVGQTQVLVPPNSKLDYKKLSQYDGASDYVNGQITWSEFLQRSPQAAKDFSEPLFYMEITPKMREEFSTGVPMKRGGEVLKGGIGSIPTK
jgi:hypothetical protein